MKTKRRYIQYLNQAEEPVFHESFSVEVGPATFTLNPFHPYEEYWNPSRGNVRVGNREIKWYNFLRK
jgi:hypothetical protein